MAYVIIGCSAFALLACFDLVAMKQIPYLKQAIGLAGSLVFAYCLLMVIRQGGTLPIPAWLSYTGLFLLVPSLFLLIYSLFLEIPFHQTYAADGAGEKLVKTGTYALVRHPGVLWLGLLLSSLVLISRSRLLFIATPVWLLMDVLYVWLQDKLFFGRMFPGYKPYREETPMLIPTRRSILRCWRSLAERRSSESESEG